MFRQLLLVAFLAYSAYTFAVVPKERGVFCTMCSSLVNEVHNLTKNGDKDIEKTLDGWCEKYFGDDGLAMTCDGFVEKECEYIIKEIDADVEPEVICVHLHMC